MAATEVVNAVLLPTELLESILIYLSITGLLQAQRVSQRWHDVIASSKRMKPNLFLAARPCHEYLHWKRENPGDREYTPFVTSEPLEGHACHKIVTPHPTFTWDTTTQGKTDLFIDIDWQQLLSWEPGQWQAMLITQPPCFEARMSYRDGKQCGPVVRNERGITLGCLRDAVMPRKAGNDRLHAVSIRREASKKKPRAIIRQRGADKEAMRRKILRVRVDGYVVNDAPYVVKAMSRLDGNRDVMLP